MGHRHSHGKSVGSRLRGQPTVPHEVACQGNCLIGDSEKWDSFKGFQPIGGRQWIAGGRFTKHDLRCVKFEVSARYSPFARQLLMRGPNQVTAGERSQIAYNRCLYVDSWLRHRSYSTSRAVSCEIGGPVDGSHFWYGPATEGCPRPDLDRSPALSPRTPGPDGSSDLLNETLRVAPRPPISRAS